MPNNFRYPPRPSRRPFKRMTESRSGLGGFGPPPRRYWEVLEAGTESDPKTIMVFQKQHVAEALAAQLTKEKGKDFVVREVDLVRASKKAVEPIFDGKVPDAAKGDTIFQLDRREANHSLTCRTDYDLCYLTLLVRNQENKETKISVEADQDRLVKLAVSILTRFGGLT